MMKTLSPLRPFLAALILALPVNPAAAAAPIDDAGAARLKTVLEDLLASQQEGIKSQGVSVKTDGPVTVEKASGYYKASLPAYVLSSPESGLSLTFGRVAINATAAEAPGQWNMAIALPTPIRMKTPDQTDVTLSIGAQNTSGVWHEALRNFVKLNSKIETVQISDSAKQFTLSIPSIVSLYDLNEKSPDQWSGPADVLLKGLSLSAVPQQGAQPFTLLVDEIGIKSTVQELSIKAMSQYREQLETLAVNAEADPNQSVSPAHAEATVKLLADLFRNAWDGFSGTLAVRGVSAQTPAAGQEPARSVRLGEGHFGMDMGGFRSGKVTIGLRLGHQGLEIVPEPEAFGPLAPALVNLDLRLENLPFKELTDLGLNAFKMAQQTPGMEQMIGLQVLASLPKLMSAAGTKITLHENRANGKLYDVTLNGQAIADSSAANGITAKGRMEVAGLDSVLAYLNGQMEKSTGPQRDALASQIGSLTVMQALGQKAKNAAGQDIRAYDFVVDPQGRMLLNGADFNSIMASRNAADGGQPHSAPPSDGTHKPGSAP